MKARAGVFLPAASFFSTDSLCQQVVTIAGDESSKLQKKKLPEGICVMPWFNLAVATDGKIAPCCEFDGDLGTLATTTLEEAWTGEALSEIRRAFVTGTEVAGCWKCFDRERAGGSSLRTDKNKDLPGWIKRLEESADLEQAAPAHPAAYDIRFSNLCNFACRSCWHGASSRWFKDGKALGVTASDKAIIRSFNSLDDAIEQIEVGLDSIEQLYFAGGEPLIIPEHFALLNLLLERGRTDIELSYNTNMSVTRFKGDSILELWKHFPNLEVHVSVDAEGDRGALVRKGFQWDRFVANVAELRRACPHARIRFGITVSVLNILRLSDLLRALESECGATPAEFVLHPLQEPIYYRTQVLPAHLKRTARLGLEEYINTLETRPSSESAMGSIATDIRAQIDYMEAENSTQYLPHLKRMLMQVDGLRSEDSLEVLPELRPAFQGLRGLWVEFRRRRQVAAERR